MMRRRIREPSTRVLSLSAALCLAFAAHGVSIKNEPPESTVDLAGETGEPSASPPAGPPNVAALDLARLLTWIEPNLGQADPAVRYLSRGRGYTLFLTDTETVLALRKAPSASRDADGLDPFTMIEEEPPVEQLRMRFVGGSFGEGVDTPSEPRPGHVHYLIGASESDWVTDVPTYDEVRFAEVYAGIDVVYRVQESGIEYDFVVQPGADFDAIAIEYEGAEALRVDERGDLIIGTPGGAELRQTKPVLYQVIDGEKSPVAGGYREIGAGRVAFTAGPYDESRPLVIDPVLEWSTYLGAHEALDVEVDSAGDIYIVGKTENDGMPAPMTKLGPGGPFHDAFVLKMTADGTSVVYATFLGGSGSNSERAHSLDVDATAHVYVTGETDSSDFPVVNAPQPTKGGEEDAFIAKLNPEGNGLIHSTYLGGDESDQGFGLCLDSLEQAHVVGTTRSDSDFPTTNALQPQFGGGSRDAFVAKLSADGSAFEYASYLGGGDRERAYGCDVGDSDHLYVVGETRSHDFPTVNPLQTDRGDYDGFVSKILPDGSGFVYPSVAKNPSLSRTGQRG